MSLVHQSPGNELSSPAVDGVGCARSTGLAEAAMRRRAEFDQNRTGEQNDHAYPLQLDVLQRKFAVEGPGIIRLCVNFELKGYGGFTRSIRRDDSPTI